MALYRARFLACFRRNGHICAQVEKTRTKPLRFFANNYVAVRSQMINKGVGPEVLEPPMVAFVKSKNRLKRETDRLQKPTGEEMDDKNISASTQNREELQRDYERHGYKDIRFLVSPDAAVSLDECVSEVLAGLKEYSSGDLQEQHGRVT
ncbi:MAG TPA: hypothetical protein PKE12_03675 [Kiritimatiellia bacterium]|nr:hypothetical protein [Kiritimatiellia bacterium]